MWSALVTIWGICSQNYLRHQAFSAQRSFKVPIPCFYTIRHSFHTMSLRRLQRWESFSEKDLQETTASTWMSLQVSFYFSQVSKTLALGRKRPHLKHAPCITQLSKNAPTNPKTRQFQIPIDRNEAITIPIWSTCVHSSSAQNRGQYEVTDKKLSLHEWHD